MKVVVAMGFVQRVVRSTFSNHSCETIREAEHSSLLSVWMQCSCAATEDSPSGHDVARAAELAEGGHEPEPEREARQLAPQRAPPHLQKRRSDGAVQFLSSHTHFFLNASSGFKITHMSICHKMPQIMTQS